MDILTHPSGLLQAVQAGAAVAVAAPLLRPNSAGAYDIG
jgi:hypothetical protein